MTTVPHDISDLHLAPVVLALDARIDELGRLDLDELALRVALSGGEEWTREQRDAGLLEAVRDVIDCHGWTLSWDPRGVRMTHGKHSVVLGVSATFADYLSGVSLATLLGARI